MKVLPGFLLVLVSLGCVDIHADKRVLVDSPIVLSPTPYVIRPKSPLRGIGPFNEICLDLPPEYRLGSEDWGANMWRVGRPDGSFVEPQVVLIDPEGNEEPVPLLGFSLGRSRQVCFDSRPSRDLKRRYLAIRLSADDTLTIHAVRWAAGHRYAGI